jgi:hypothetical protein
VPAACRAFRTTRHVGVSYQRQPDTWRAKLEDPQGSLMTLLPIYLPQGMTLTHLSNAMLPWFRASPQTVETSVVVILVRGVLACSCPRPAGAGWACPLCLPPGAAEVSGVKGGRRPSRAARCAAPLRPEGAAPYPQRARAGERRRSRLLCAARAAGRPRSRGVPSRQGQLVIHRGAHAQRRVPSAVVVFLDPRRDPGPGSRLPGGLGQ